MINKVTKKDINDAFDYFMDTGRLEELKSDDVYYIQALLKHIANQQNIKLVFNGSGTTTILKVLQDEAEQ